MKAQKKQPELRFKGFTDDWEQSKLKNMAESLNYGLNVESREYDGRNKYIRITDINDVSRKFTPDPITSPNVDISELNDDYKLQLGDVLFARTGASVGKTYHYESSDGNLYYAGFLIRARIKTAFSSMFLHQFTWGQKYKRFVNITSQRSGQPGINAKEYGNLTLLLPNYKEQQKIGEFFRKLDRTITLQQRKLELFKKLKQGYLQQMFPSKDQYIPRLRFKEFNGDWEQVKLGNIFEKKNELNRNQFTENRTISIATMTFKPSGNGADENSIPKYKVLRLGDIAFEGHKNKDFAFGRFLMNDIGDGIISPRFTFLHAKEKLDIDFWKYYIHHESIMRTILVKSTKQGTMMNELVVTDFLKQGIKVPEKSEQKIIGIFLTRLDHTITLQQNEIEQLQQLKQAYLQKLFP